MPTHAEKRVLKHSRDHLYQMVADVEQYPQFLPWCTALRIRSRSEQHITADMVIGFKIFREKFTTRVTFSPPNRIDVEYLNGPFRYLNNHWIFIPQDDGSCMVDFYVDFEFHSKILQKTIGLVFNEAVQKMIGAFESRADALYGKSS